MNKDARPQVREQIHYIYNSVTMTDYVLAPTSFPEHWHLSAEFILAKKDDCTYTIGKDTYHINQGDLLLIWPAELHSTVRTPENSSLLLQFSSSVIDYNADISAYLPLLQARHLISANDSNGLNHKITKLIAESYEIFCSQDPFSETSIKINIYKILMLIARDELYKQKSIPDANSSSGATYHKIRKACAYIAKNCERDLLQTEVADYAGFSHYYFSRLFKEYTTLSFNDYLTSQRIRKAIRFLSSDNVSITDVAYQSGFQSISNFNRAFKLAMNCTPRQFRNMYYSQLSRKGVQTPVF